MSDIPGHKTEMDTEFKVVFNATQLNVAQCRSELCSRLYKEILAVEKYLAGSESIRKGKPRPEIPVQLVIHGDDGENFEQIDLPQDKPGTRMTVASTDMVDYLFRFSVAEFWQSRWFHLPPESLHRPLLPLNLINTKDKRHPRRPSWQCSGESLIRRHIPVRGKVETLELRLAELSSRQDDSDLSNFHAWHNTDRVNAFWGERGTLEQHKAYLERQLADPHVLPTIGRIGTTRFGYFEIYWAKEDNIAPFANAQDYDRGFHALVGDTPYRGPDIVPHWIAAITQYCFLDDPRTMRVMLEPRADNHKFIKYLIEAGFSKEKEFDFPHKRAALMTITREHFFENHPPSAAAAAMQG